MSDIFIANFGGKAKKAASCYSLNDKVLSHLNVIERDITGFQIKGVDKELSCYILL